ncbi:hypothetical protein BC826DRAFT_1007721 [Russula brevipes]|nr:hypothetical protein BC826DRAFT_1007721 [Russula brevipes]
MQLEPIGASDDTNVKIPYIAENAVDCDMAIVHDDDLACINSASLDSIKTDALMEHLRRTAPEIHRIQCASLPSAESGAETVVTANVAVLSKDEFRLVAASSNVPSVEPQIGKAKKPDRIAKPQGDIWRSGEAVHLVQPVSLGKSVSQQQGAPEVVTSPPLQSTDLSGKVSRVREHWHVAFEGWFQDFYLGEWNLDGDRVALGRLRDQSPASKTRFKERIKLWHGLHHPNVLSFFGHVEIGGAVYSVSPWVGNGTVREYLRGNPDADRTRLLNQVASGVEFLHENGIAHGDLCGKNVLIDHDGTAIICGFNLSDFASPEHDTARVRWLAPEQNISGGAACPTEMADIWSFGSLCLEVFTGRDPRGTPPEIDEVTAIAISTKMWELVQSCWQVDPEERPSMSMVHSTITGILSPRSSHSRISTSLAPRTLAAPSKSKGSLSGPHSTTLGKYKVAARQSTPSLLTLLLQRLGQNRQWVRVSSEVLALMDKVASDTECFLRSGEDGAVLAGNLEGLVTRAITVTADSHKDNHFKAVFLTTYQLFATSERLFEILKRRFESAGPDRAELQARSRSSILLFIESWLKKGFDDEDLSCSLMMKEFTLAISGAQRMKGKAAEITSLIDNFDNVCLRKPVPVNHRWLLRKSRPPGVRPSDLAGALTAVEGDQFKRVTYWDYVNFIRQRPDVQRIEILNALHSNITKWVQRSVMEPDHLGERMTRYEEWINIAQLCGTMNNFSSASAIVTALMSPMVTKLVLTCESKAKKILHKLDKDLTPTNGAYYNTLHQAESKEVIPWLEPHLTALNLTFTRSNPLVEVDGHYLIDFELCGTLAEQIDSITQYSPPPDVRSETRRDVLEYVEYNLQPNLGDRVARATEARGAKLAKEEQSMLAQRERMQALGIPWFPPHQERSDKEQRRGEDVARREKDMGQWSEEDKIRRHEKETMWWDKDKDVAQLRTEVKSQYRLPPSALILYEGDGKGICSQEFLLCTYDMDAERIY